MKIPEETKAWLFGGLSGVRLVVSQPLSQLFKPLGKFSCLLKQPTAFID